MDNNQYLDVDLIIYNDVYFDCKHLSSIEDLGQR